MLFLVFDQVQRWNVDYRRRPSEPDMPLLRVFLYGHIHTRSASQPGNRAYVVLRAWRPELVSNLISMATLSLNGEERIPLWNRAL